MSLSRLPEDYYGSIRQGRRLPRYCLGSDCWAGKCETGRRGGRREAGERTGDGEGKEKEEGRRKSELRQEWGVTHTHTLTHIHTGKGMLTPCSLKCGERAETLASGPPASPEPWKLTWRGHADRSFFHPLEQTLPVLLRPVPPQASGFRLEAWGLCEGERLRRPREGSSGNWVWIQGLGHPDDFSEHTALLSSAPVSRR